MLMQTQWKSLIGPILSKEIVNNNFLQSLSMISGSNTINHKLGRNLQGWFIVRQNAAASFYDQQDTNTNPSQTLILHASAPCTISLVVF